MLVIGAGVAGMPTAVHLQRCGYKVAVMDPYPPPGGASFGNGGFISPCTFIPSALPGMLRKVPGWLCNPEGPLSIQPSQALQATPWLMQWIRSGRLDRVREITDALYNLHQDSFERWKELLGQASFTDLIRTTGQLLLWDTVEVGRSEELENKLRDERCVPWQRLEGSELRERLPGLSREVVRATFLPRNGYTISPARLIQSLVQRFLRDGGTLVPERALLLLPLDDGSWKVISNIGNHVANMLVLAAGAFSAQLTAPLRIKLPIQVQRGYHVTLPMHFSSPIIPFIHRGRGVGMTPMEDGLRVAGTVEFTSLDSVPNVRRAQILREQAIQVFPNLDTSGLRWWSGDRPSTPDSLPILGPVRDMRNLYLCVGHGHTGMTGGPLSGKVVAQCIAGQPTAVDLKPYSLDRFSGRT